MGDVVANEHRRPPRVDAVGREHDHGGPGGDAVGVGARPGNHRGARRKRGEHGPRRPRRQVVGALHREGEPSPPLPQRR
ncbi:hypothetical protein, partial [Microbacterium sp.]|uniref:hypothetical protein n=1 Tax=Microbacterium sp. TaxID=51671 RepID=UPI00391CEF09